MSKLIYPTLDLYHYDLRSSLGSSEDEKENFLQKIPETEREQIRQSDKIFDVQYKKLSKPIEFKEKTAEYPLQGYYWPMRIGDSYGLLLDCSIDDKVNPQPLETIKILKKTIKEKLNYQNPRIGETWMISGILSPDEQEDSKEIAKKCYKTLFPKGNWKKNFKGEGELLGAKIFEIECYNIRLEENLQQNDENIKIQDIQENQHLVIIIHSNQKTYDESCNFFDNWMKLFCYRHKILFCYGQSIFLKQKMQNEFILIKKSINSLKKEVTENLNLNFLAELLEELEKNSTPYTINLDLFIFQGMTIETNLYSYEASYQIFLQEINNKFNVDKSNLKFLERFSQLVSKQYFLQIQKDTQKFEKGLNLLKTSIDTINSLVEVKQAKNQESFQNLATFFGICVAIYNVFWDFNDRFELLDSSNNFKGIRFIIFSQLLPFLLSQKTPLIIIVVISFVVYWLNPKKELIANSLILTLKNIFKSFSQK